MNRSRKTRRPTTSAAPRGAKKWALLIQECQRGGIEPRVFCKERGLSLKTFQWWRWALANGRRRVPGRDERETNSPSEKARGPAPVVRFLEVSPPQEQQSASSRIHSMAQNQKKSSPGVEVIVRRGEEFVVRVDREFETDIFCRVVHLLGEVTRC